MIILRLVSIRLAVVALLGAAACSIDSLIPRDAVEFTPPPLYHIYWRTVEACSELQGPFGEVTWFRTSGPAASGSHAVGAWFPSTNSIVLNENFDSTASVVRHEMLHAMERSSRHSARYLQGCGELVACVEECLSQGGPTPVAPGPTAPEIQASSLVISHQVVSAQAGGGGYTSVIVRARNPLAQAVFVPLQSASGMEFVCTMDGVPCDGLSVLGPGARSPFGSAQTRQWAFTFTSSPGTHQVIIGFDTFLPDTVLIVVP